MNRTGWLLLILAACAAGVGGFWMGHTRMPMPAETTVGVTVSGTGPIIYFQDPDGLPAYTEAPAKKSDGRPYRPVRASEDIDVTPGQSAPPKMDAASSEKKIRYYRNPMGLPDISKAPKKNSMGMDYIPVYEGEQEDSTAVTLSPGKLQRTGVVSEKATFRVLSVPVRAPGTIQLDERRASVVSVRSESFVDTVENVTTGSDVKRGQPLLRIYSPAIASAAAEYLSVLNSRIGIAAVNGSRQRLINLAVPSEVIAQIDKTREAPLTFTWSAPRDGIVLERNVVDGQRAMPGDVLFRVADHSVVWALVDVSERDLAVITEGQKVTLKASAYPDRAFHGTVALVYPHLMPATRTARVRIELPNDDLLLRPDMYVEAAIDTGNKEPVLASA